jgi:DNA-binding protein HU-beta
MAGKSLTQAQINEFLSDNCGLKKSVVKEALSALANLAASEVNKNGEFTVPGFGKLVKSTSKARKGRNPATGATITIPAKTTVKFRVGKAMKDSVA